MGEEVVRIAESKRKAEVKQASDEKRILRAESQERLRFWIPRLHRSWRHVPEKDYGGEKFNLYNSWAENSRA